ncbi:MAG: hypothetical protein H7834_13725 [Magnetococcus sp. YQC-9]
MENQIIVVASQARPYSFVRTPVITFDCPGCKNKMNVREGEVSFGSVVECGCGNKTYFPYQEKDKWYRDIRFVITIIVSIVLFFAGVYWPLK